MLKEKIAQYKLPDTPGVYLFKGLRGKILYVGKATSLKSRVRSYFAKDLMHTRGERVVKMLTDAVSLTWQETDSVLEALILEAALIKKHQPPANVRDRDNKSFNYLVITNEAFPRILSIRGRELFQHWKEKDIKYLFGPFPQGSSLKEALKIVRKIFPYRDSCVPGEKGKRCFNAQLGLCPGICSGEASEKEYARAIRHIVLLFSGKKKSLVLTLEKEMKKAIKVESFEEAAYINKQIQSLRHIRDVALIKSDHPHSTGGDIAMRIEAYDVAHTAGSETVGVMTVVEDGEIRKDQYKKFKIRTVTNNDIHALKEILERRFNHPEWQLPRLIVVDGGKTHITAARKILNENGIDVPIVAVLKDEHHKPKEIVGGEEFILQQKAILLANAEAHRFAIGWHRKRLTKRLTA